MLQGLPWYMRENPSTIMKMCEVSAEMSFKMIQKRVHNEQGYTSRFRGRLCMHIWQSISKALSLLFFVSFCMKPTDPEEDVIKGMVIGILSVVEDVKEPLPASYFDVALVIEERIVIRHLGDVPNAFVNLMGLQYMLNLDYPKDLKYTFEVIQRQFMGIGLDSCTPRVHSLKNKLLS